MVITGVFAMKEQTEIGKIKEGRYIVIDDEPCRVIGIATSKPGKHGAAKARIDALGIFDGVKRSIVHPYPPRHISLLLSARADR